MLTAICDVMKECYHRGWLTTRDGNCSHKDGLRNYMHITPSGSRKNVLRVSDLIKIKYDKKKELIILSNSNPSGELQMHNLLLRVASQTRVVLHVHPTHCVSAMYAGFKLNELADQFPELYRYTQVGPNVAALPVTSPELAIATASKIGLQPDGTCKYDIVGQDRHGITTWAGDPWAAFEHIERLNHICEIVLASR